MRNWVDMLEERVFNSNAKLTNSTATVTINKWGRPT